MSADISVGANSSISMSVCYDLSARVILNDNMIFT